MSVPEPIWRTVPSHPSYEVSNSGFVRRTETNTILKRRLDNSGYIIVTLNAEEDRINKRVHLMVAEAFLERPTDASKCTVNHKNNDRTDCSAANLEWATASEQQKQVWKTGARAQMKPPKHQHFDEKKDTLPEEEWRPVSWAPEYKVSNKGRIVSYRTSKPKLMRPPTENGYKRITLTINGQKKSFQMHRLVKEMFTGTAPAAGSVVDHKNEERKDNDLSNLEYCTQRQNVEAAVGRKVCQYNALDGTLVATHASLSRAAEVIAGNRHSIKYAADRQRAYRGFVWKWCQRALFALT
jgi:hypothetical protein